MRLMDSLGMPTSPPQPAGERFFADWHEPGRGPDATAFRQMMDDVLCGGLRALRGAQGRPASLRAFFPAGTTAQQAETIMAIHLPDDEVVGSGGAQQLAVSMDTGSSVPGGSLHAGLLQNRWSLSQGLHTTRPRLSTPSAMIPGHYRGLLCNRT